MAKAFKITQNNQYVQQIALNPGEYTFSAWIRADNITYKFGLRKMDNQLVEFDVSSQLVFQNWAKVRLTFQLTEQVKEFSLMSSGAGRTWQRVPYINPFTSNEFVCKVDFKNDAGPYPTPPRIWVTSSTW